MYRVATSMSRIRMIVIISSDVKTPLESIIIKNEEEEEESCRPDDINQAIHNEQSNNRLQANVCKALHIPLDSFDDIVCKTLLVRSTITTANDAGEQENIINILIAFK
jgi:hypothetical protein